MHFFAEKKKKKKFVQTFSLKEKKLKNIARKITQFKEIITFFTRWLLLLKIHLKCLKLLFYQSSDGFYTITNKVLL